MIYTEYLKKMLDDKVLQIQQGMIGTIESFDRQTMRADVLPIIAQRNDDGDLQQYPVLPRIPVGLIWAGGFYLCPDYKKGDLVWITFATRDIDEPMRENVKEESKKVFGLENACVICSVAKTNRTMPTEFSESGLLIGHEDGNAYIRFEDDKIVMVFGTREITFDANGIKSDSGIIFHTLDGHFHSSFGTPPTPNT